VGAIHCEVTGLTATVTNSVLARPSSVPPLIPLRPLQSVPLALLGLFLSKLTKLELWPSPMLELTTAAVAVIELVVISLSPVLDRYRLHGLNRWCVPPGQQVIFTSSRGMHPCLT
jgi:hypothetical protein